MKMVDLSKEQGWMNNIELGSDKIEEIADFNVDDKVELHIICKVKGVRKCEENDMPIPEPSDKDEEKKEDKKPKEYIRADMQILECGIMNVKEDRVKAEKMGMDYKDYKEVRAKVDNKKSSEK
jgi:hypothetical protein